MNTTRKSSIWLPGFKKSESRKIISKKSPKKVSDRWFTGEHEEYGRKWMEAFMPCYKETENKLSFSKRIEKLYQEHHEKLKDESESKVRKDIV